MWDAGPAEAPRTMWLDRDGVCHQKLPLTTLCRAAGGGGSSASQVGPVLGQGSPQLPSPQLLPHSRRPSLPAGVGHQEHSPPC